LAAEATKDVFSSWEDHLIFGLHQFQISDPIFFNDIDEILSLYFMEDGEDFWFGCQSIDLILDKIYPAEDVLLVGLGIDGNILALLPGGWVPPIDDLAFLDDPQLLSIWFIGWIDGLFGCIDHLSHLVGDLLEEVHVERFPQGRLQYLEIRRLEDVIFYVGVKGTQDLLFLLLVVDLDDLLSIEEVRPCLAFQWAWDSRPGEKAIQFSEVGLEDIGFLPLHLDQVPNVVDEVPEDEGAEHLQEGDESSLEIIWIEGGLLAGTMSPKPTVQSMVDPQYHPSR
jgi:hypothetical protein